MFNFYYTLKKYADTKISGVIVATYKFKIFILRCQVFSETNIWFQKSKLELIRKLKQKILRFLFNLHHFKNLTKKVHFRFLTSTCMCFSNFYTCTIISKWGHRYLRLESNPVAIKFY